MEQTAHTVVHKTQDYPTGLKSAEEMAEILGSISAIRILELADAGYLPHYRIDGGAPIFKATEVKQWVSQNILAKCAGRALPNAIKIVVNAPPVFDNPPVSICNIPALQQIPKHGYQPGIYFLCKENQVVYVGQSKTPSSRVASHNLDTQKDFDTVYLLPVPESELDDVEAAFIHHLKPAQQGGIRIGREKPVSPRMTVPKEKILERFGINE